MPEGRTRNLRGDVIESRRRPSPRPDLEFTMSPACPRTPSHRAACRITRRRRDCGRLETIVLRPATTVNVRARGVAHSGVHLRSPRDHDFLLVGCPRNVNVLVCSNVAPRTVRRTVQYGTIGCPGTRTCTCV